jgi:hypothetical protein
VRPTLVAAILAVVVAGSACARRSAPQPDAASARLAARPLAGLAGQPLIVLPARYLRPAPSGDSLGWAAQVGSAREYLARIDDELAFAVRERGVAPQWTWPPDLARLARRNASFTTDPYQIAAEQLRPGRRKREPEIADPLASQLRSLVALSDSRFALVPVEVRFEPRGGGTGRAVLHLALVDARLARISWAGEIASDSATTLTPALAASLGERFADLIAAP